MGYTHPPADLQQPPSIKRRVSPVPRASPEFQAPYPPKLPPPIPTPPNSVPTEQRMSPVVPARNTGFASPVTHSARSSLIRTTKPNIPSSPRPQNSFLPGCSYSQPHSTLPQLSPRQRVHTGPPPSYSPEHSLGPSPLSHTRSPPPSP